MSLSIEFATLTEMFQNICQKYSANLRPVLMEKSDGSYHGIRYQELYEKAERFALGLSALDVQRGERIALISENRLEWVIADMGIMHLGAVSVPLYPTLVPKQLEYVFNDARISIAVVSNQLHLSKLLKIIHDVPSLKKIIIMNSKGLQTDERSVSFARVMELGSGRLASEPGFLSRASRAITPDDLLTIIYTSGTTGNPKGVMLTHRNLASNIRSSASCLSIMEGDLFLSYLPLCHSFERMAGYYTAMACGATIAYAESIDAVAENIREIKPTIMTSVPRLFERLHQKILKQVDLLPPVKRGIFRWAIGTGKVYTNARRERRTNPVLSLKMLIADKLVFTKLRERTGGRIRFFVSGGAPLSPELGEFFEAIGLRIVEGYGLSETSPVISINPLDDRRFGTVGKPIPDVEIKFASDGEILARGPNIMKGYWNDRESTKEVIDGDGWLSTGDIGHLDAAGYLHITDRKKHLFVSSGGKNIAPQPIENQFLRNNYIDQFLLIGDGRMYCTALIVPDFELLASRLRELGISFDSTERLVTSPEAIRFFEEEISSVQKDLSNYERVRKFTLLKTAFTAENSELTPTLKIRRKFVEERYREVIDKMYEGAG